jgi:hypothetical protein
LKVEIQKSAPSISLEDSVIYCFRDLAVDR